MEEITITPKGVYFEFDKAAALFPHGFTALQKDSINTIVDEVNRQGATKQQAAYILATAYHECYNPKTPETRLTPMREFGGEVYLRGKKKYYPYYGRGFSQLTWQENYKKETERMQVDLVEYPDLLLQIPLAANSHVYCMLHGVYTGKKLGDYINAEKVDFVNARRIVNGTDKADLIAGYAKTFLNCLIEL